jgi:hypothetical protein
MGVVELLDKGQGFRFVLRGEYGGQLSGEGRVVGRRGEGGAEEAFRLGILLFGDEQVGESGIGGGGLGVVDQGAAKGGFRGGGLAGRSFDASVGSPPPLLSAWSIRARARQARAFRAGPASPGSSVVAVAISLRASVSLAVLSAALGWALAWRASSRPRERWDSNDCASAPMARR